MTTDEIQMLSRRRFLGQAGCAALSATGLFSSLLHTRLMGQVAAASNPTDYKALVCLFLLGGNDSYNMLPPRGANSQDPLYTGYATARGGLPGVGGLALPWDQISALTPLGTNPLIGVHYKLPKLARIFNEDRKLAFLTNVGTLLQDDTTSDKLGLSGYLPLGAYSHSDQQEQWQTCFLSGRSATGWGGLMLDSLYADLVPWACNISIGGVNVWQTGQSSRIGASSPFSVNPSGTLLLDGPSSNTTAYENLFSTAVDGLFGSTLESVQPGILDKVFHRSLGKSNTQAKELAAILNPPSGQQNPNDEAVKQIFAPYASNPLATDLLLVARMIALRNQFDFGGVARRQTFFVGFGGWDHHDEVINKQAGMFPVVDDAVDAFYRAMQAIGALNEVTLFSASDFGRTLTSNGQGSDHGWGGNQFVLGGKVSGGRFYGQYPSLDPTALQTAKLDAGRLRVIPTTAVDQYFATMAKWIGVPTSSMNQVFPNLANFAVTDLGFMQA